MVPIGNSSGPFCVPCKCQFDDDRISVNEKPAQLAMHVGEDSPRKSRPAD
jgi:hypothetical protein